MRLQIDRQHWLATRRHLLLSFAAVLFAAPQFGCGRTQADSDTAATPSAAASLPAPTAVSSATSSPTPSLSARQLLQRTAQAYREAKTYADVARLRFKIQPADGPEQDPDPIDASITFERANKIRIHYDDLVLASDGKHLRAAIGSIPGQLLDIDAPAKLTAEDLMSGFSGPALAAALDRGPASFPIQAQLLLAENANLSENGKIELMGDATFDGHACRRVAVQTDVGREVLWIDPESFTLRLVELPTDGLRKQIEAEKGPLKFISETLELQGARLNEPVPDLAFEFPVPDGTTLVKRLIGPPPAPPSPLLGKAVPDFSFTGIDAPAVSQKSLAGKVAVLDFWFTDCPPCQQSFPLLNSVFEKYKDRVSFVGVSVDPPSVGDGQIRDTAKKWGGNFPLARDTANLVAKLQIPGEPTLMVLAADGTVQDQESGFNPRMSADLAGTIEMLLSGKSTADEAQKRYQQVVDEYNRAIQEPPAPANVVQLPQAKIAPHDEPKSLHVQRLWDCTDLKAPGNILVVEDPRDPKAEPKLLVLDGPHTVVELVADGKVQARHELAVPEQAVVTFLRTGVDGAGKRYFAGSASGQQQLFLFDADWKPLLNFPKPEQGPHAGIGDVQLVDLGGDGKLILAVGYWQLVGVQGVSLDGQRLWTDRSMENVLRLAPSGHGAKGARRLLCTNSRGSLVPIDAQGKAGTEWLLPGLMLETVFSADSPDGSSTRICSIARNTRLEQLVVGLGPAGEDLWHYPMSQTIYTTPIEPLTTIALAEKTRQWLIAGPDGSINIVAFDGKPIDSFHYGRALTGLAGARHADQSILLVSTAGHVEAWRIEPK
jgi:thiol-disulfide isomerase/thioredoxin